MKSLYLRELDLARTHVSDAESLSYLCSTLRSLLQVIAITALEVARQATPVINGELDIKRFIDRFGHPSDGLPIETLDYLVPVIRSFVSRKYFPGWFEHEEILGKPLVAALNEWVTFRNNRPGHGVLDGPTTSEWALKSAALIERILEKAPDTLPVVGPNGLSAKVGDVVVPIATPLVVDGHAIVVSNVASRKGIWRIRAQMLSWVDARELTIDLPPSNLFALDDQLSEKFRWKDVPRASGPRLVLHNVPARQTSNFVGRKKELEKLAHWLEETNEWNTCLIYGDGGFGKTTLALEFFNRLLDATLEGEPPLPSIISFYTAKRTKWTEEGLVHFRGISGAMEDGVRELMYSFYPVLGKEWYAIEGRALIDRVAAELRAQKFARDDVLLIIDNTETLATSTQDAEELAEFLSKVGKSIGRIVITSRRRELLAAVPVQVSQLSETEAVMLIQKLGTDLGARAINQAGESRLRRACGQVMHKPLLIDTLVRYIARSGSSIDDGLNHILGKTNDQLLEFLYEDAWERMNAAVQEVFVVLVLLATPLDSKSVGDTCREAKVLHSEFLSSLEETYFASLVDHGDTYELEIVELAKKFFLRKKAVLSKESADRLEKIAFKVDKLANERFEIEKHYRQDRVADAYQSDYAKAAKIAVIKKDYNLAKDSFELALLEEPLNAALHERFASFLLRNFGKAELALQPAERAAQLLPESADAWLTLGLVQYSLGRLNEGDVAIDKAQRFGKADALCHLRKAIARYHVAKREPYGKRAVPLLKEAEALVDLSLRAGIPKDFYYKKNQHEAVKYAALIRSLLTMINRREVIAENSPEAK